MEMSGFTRKIEFTPAYDKRNPDPHKNYGIHGVNMRFLLFGDSGVIQFVIYTNWHLPHVQRELELKQNAGLYLSPMPADVGYHSPKPLYDGQTPISDHCEYLNGAPCYYGGSGLYAEEVFEVFVTDGEEAMWKLLEESYHRWLD